MQGISPGPAAETIPPSVTQRSKPLYRCGTLTYTRVGLIALFGWLLWGDFCFTLMEAIVPSVLPFKLKNLGCSNLVMGVILSTIPGVLNMTVCPYVSFKSDRFRSKWGRRIPFILCTLPFLSISLALLGWSDDLTVFLQKHSEFLQNSAPFTITIILIAVFMIMFEFFNMFVSSVFWYLFNDVVPAQFLGRFVGMFRIVGALSGSLYSYFIFKYAESHMKEIMLWTSLLYLVGFGIVCFMIKEGEYPPVEEIKEEKKPSRFRDLKIFFTESFNNRYYWLVYIFTAVHACAGAIAIFRFFYYQQMGLSLDQIGKLRAIVSVAALVAMYFSAIFIDRWHPVRVNAYLAIFGVAGNLMGWVWLFVSIPGNYFFWMTLGISIAAAFHIAMVGGAMLPLYMRSFPKSRYGQICASQALFRSLCVLVCSLIAGGFMDLMKWVHHGSDYAYRYYFAWPLLFSIFLAIAGVILYRQWYKLGGDASYHPPASWNSEGMEKIAIVPIVGPQSRWLNWSFRLYDAIMVLSVIGIIPFMYWMNAKEMSVAFFWHCVAILPASVAILMLWFFVKKGVLLDMERSRNGHPLRNGIPHHGIMIVIACQYLLNLPIWGFQMFVTISNRMETGTIVFTIANLAINLVLIGCIWYITRVERGHLTRLDTMLAVAE
ncbi:MAG: MFS transporter [Lentisphaerota bacterium]